MWVLRVLSGPQAGKTIALKPGTNVVGRSPNADVRIVSAGVSKEHAKIDVLERKIVITDLGSRNGTFVNGVQVMSQRLNPNDKIVLNDVILDVVPITMVQGAAPGAHPFAPGPAYHGNTAYAAQPDYAAQAPAAVDGAPVGRGLQGFVAVAKNYIDEVVLPGIYKLAEWMELRWVLGLFMGAFIVFVTSLSAIPLMRILKTSIEKESQRRAMTIAKTLSTFNRGALMQGVESSVSVEIAQREPGVEEALIVSNVDGNIIAPASKAGQYPNNSFIHRARKEGRDVVEQLDDDTIGALVPIEFYNANTGTQSISAYAVVIYNMGSLAVDDGRTLSLFIQTLFIALIVGGILFFFMYKLIEFPFLSLNHQIDRALKDGSATLEVTYQFPPLQTLISNVNSALNRAISGSGSGPSAASEHDRSQEMNNLVQLIGFGAMAVAAHDRTIACVNAAFEERTGLSASNLLHSTVSAITDQALKLSVMDLMERVEANPDQMATNQLEFGGQNCEIAAQAVYGSQRVAYYVFVLLPLEGGH